MQRNSTSKKLKWFRVLHLHSTNHVCRAQFRKDYQPLQGQQGLQASARDEVRVRKALEDPEESCDASTVAQRIRV